MVQVHDEDWQRQRLLRVFRRRKAEAFDRGAVPEQGRLFGVGPRQVDNQRQQRQGHQHQHRRVLPQKV